MKSILYLVTIFVLVASIHGKKDEEKPRFKEKLRYYETVDELRNTLDSNHPITQENNPSSSLDGENYPKSIIHDLKYENLNSGVPKPKEKKKFATQIAKILSLGRSEKSNKSINPVNKKSKHMIDYARKYYENSKGQDGLVATRTYKKNPKKSTSATNPSESKAYQWNPYLSEDESQGMRNRPLPFTPDALNQLTTKEHDKIQQQTVPIDSMRHMQDKNKMLRNQAFNNIYFETFDAPRSSRDQVFNPVKNSVANETIYDYVYNTPPPKTTYTWKPYDTKQKLDTIYEVDEEPVITWWRNPGVINSIHASWKNDTSTVFNAPFFQNFTQYFLKKHPNLSDSIDTQKINFTVSNSILTKIPSLHTLQTISSLVLQKNIVNYNTPMVTKKYSESLYIILGVHDPNYFIEFCNKINDINSYKLKLLLDHKKEKTLRLEYYFIISPELVRDLMGDEKHVYVKMTPNSFRPSAIDFQKMYGTENNKSNNYLTLITSDIKTYEHLNSAVFRNSIYKITLKNSSLYMSNTVNKQLECRLINFEEEIMNYIKSETKLKYRKLKGTWDIKLKNSNFIDTIVPYFEWETNYYTGRPHTFSFWCMKCSRSDYLTDWLNILHTYASFQKVIKLQYAPENYQIFLEHSEKTISQHLRIHNIRNYAMKVYYSYLKMITWIILSLRTCSPEVMTNSHITLLAPKRVHSIFYDVNTFEVYLTLCSPDIYCQTTPVNCEKTHRSTEFFFDRDPYTELYIPYLRYDETKFTFPPNALTISF